MAMNPRDAANAKGFIDSVISFTKTKLLPHVPEMTIRFAHNREDGKFPMRLSKIILDCSCTRQYGESGRRIKYDRLASSSPPLRRSYPELQCSSYISWTPI